MIWPLSILFARRNRRRADDTPRDSFPGEIVSECILAKAEALHDLRAAGYDLDDRAGWVVKLHECTAYRNSRPCWYDSQTRQMVGGLTWPPWGISEVAICKHTRVYEYPNLVHEAKHWWLGTQRKEWGHPQQAFPGFNGG